MRALIVFMVLLVPFHSHAIFENSDPDDGDPTDDLFDYAYGHGAAVTSEEYVIHNGVKLSVDAGLSAYQDTWYGTWDNTTTTELRYVDRECFIAEETDDDVQYKCNSTTEVYYANADPARWGTYAYNKKNARYNKYEGLETYSCPPEDTSEVGGV